MSRIHEALKKAAEQRAPLASRSPEAVMLEVTAEEQDQGRAKTVEGATLSAEIKKPARSIVPPSFADITSKCAHPTWKLDPRFTVFSGLESNQSSAERFRTLRSRLSQIRDTRPLKKILITSSVPAEGKSFIVSNLAQSFVRQADRRVLLIDADLRAPRLHSALGTKPRPGLAEYLTGEADEYQIIQQGEEENLCFIPYGSETADPSELLSRERMRKLMEFVSPAFDWILLDSPPVLPVHDASILADLCDGVLFVVKAGATESAVAEKAVAEFRQKNLLGVVLNGTDRSDSYGGYYYYDSEYKSSAAL
jgi:capsular exopolysaccharide synthesis family protein